LGEREKIKFFYTFLTFKTNKKLIFLHLKLIYLQYIMNVNMDFVDIRLDEFINNIIKCNSIDDILDKCKTQSIKGFVFERLWDIIIKFGFCPIFSNSKFIHKIGNVNNGKLKTLENLTSLFLY